MDGNQLSSLGASVLGQLPSLTFLSMANNCITSLHGIWKVRSLLELYVESNQISSSRDIYFLKVRKAGYNIPIIVFVFSDLISSLFFLIRDWQISSFWIYTAIL